MPLRADDGTELPVKEGVVLDQQETVILYSGKSEQNSKDYQGEKSRPEASSPFQSLFFGKWAVLIAITGIVMMTVVLGTFFLGIFLTGLIVISLIQGILRLFRVKL